MKKFLAAAAAVSIMALSSGAMAAGDSPWVCTKWVDAAQIGMDGMGGMGGMSGMDGMSGMGGMSGMDGMSGMGGMSGMEGHEGQACAQWTHKSVQ